jgi:hypothetical protein
MFTFTVFHLLQLHAVYKYITVCTVHIVVEVAQPVGEDNADCFGHFRRVFHLHNMLQSLRSYKVFFSSCFIRPKDITPRELVETIKIKSVEFPVEDLLCQLL